jgi:1-deoxy-D-xylulose-5-phosphate reductoisomerase
VKRITILGSTGSIGRQALEVIAAESGRFKVAGLAAKSDITLLAQQARLFYPEMVAVADEGLFTRLRDELADTGVKVLAGMEGVSEVAAMDNADLVLAAMVGASGIVPALAAIEAGKDIALANKEILVSAGALVASKALSAGVRLLPVDSEHSAVFQCLAGVERRDLRRVVLTASGGPFRSLSRTELDHVTVAQALNHPSWRMGDKVTVDSATLINKGLEIIEAHWLFNLDFDQIGVIVHPESIVHSMVELVDGAFIAQLGVPDMRLPIAYALGYPERLAGPWPRLDSLAGMTLHFSPVDADLFPAISLAYAMGRNGGTYPAVMSAANEVAVAAFLREEIKFSGIVRIVSEVCGHHGGGEEQCPSLEEILAADAWARVEAEELVTSQKR